MSAWEPRRFGLGTPPFLTNGLLVSRLRNAKILADLSCEVVVDFVVTGNGTAFVLGRIVPPRVTAAFPEKCAAMGSEMSQQIAAFHTAMVSSS